MAATHETNQQPSYEVADIPEMRVSTTPTLDALRAESDSGPLLVRRIEDLAQIMIANPKAFLDQYDRFLEGFVHTAEHKKLVSEALSEVLEQIETGTQLTIIQEQQVQITQLNQQLVAANNKALKVERTSEEASLAADLERAQLAVNGLTVRVTAIGAQLRDLREDLKIPEMPAQATEHLDDVLLRLNLPLLSEAIKADRSALPTEATPAAPSTDEHFQVIVEGNTWPKRIRKWGKLALEQLMPDFVKQEPPHSAEVRVVSKETA